MTDIEVIKRLQQMDPEALAEVRRTHGGRVYAQAIEIVRDPWDAEEVVQDVFWTAYRKAKTLDEPEKFDSWLFRVTRNTALMLLRKRKRIPTPTEEEVVEVASRELENPFEPERMLVRRRALVQAQQAFDALKPMSQRVFMGMDVEGRTKEEVASELGISIAALKSRLHRARLDIRRALTPVLG